MTECAAHRWYVIGLGLGYNDGQIESMVKGIALDADKLTKIVNNMKMAKDSSIVAQQLLRVCEEIPNPVIAAVREKIRQLQSNMQ